MTRPVVRTPVQIIKINNKFEPLSENVRCNVLFIDGYLGGLAELDRLELCEPPGWLRAPCR